MNELVLIFSLGFGFVVCLLGIIWKLFRVILKLTEFVKQDLVNHYEAKITALSENHQTKIKSLKAKLEGEGSRFTPASDLSKSHSSDCDQVLNEHFFFNLANPFPSEEVKEELARRCGITVPKVSKWLDNKRVRYTGNVSKAQEEAIAYAAKTTKESAASNVMSTPCNYPWMKLLGKSPRSDGK